MLRSLGEEESTRFMKEKKEKEKKKTLRGQKWIGRDERVSYDM